MTQPAAAFRIERVVTLEPAQLDAILRESQSAGWHFLQRLIEDWARGSNRFDQAGEVLYFGCVDEAVVATIGLNIDAHAAAPNSGRVRRLYVAEACRGAGCGAQMLRAVIAVATGRFEQLLVRADRPSSAGFFEHLGFRPATAEPEATHQLVLPFTSRAPR